MSSPTDDSAEPGGREPRPAGDAGLFAGDTGELPMDTRRVLVHLLLGPALDAERQTKLWPVLLRDERVLRSRLHELFLELVIDHEQRVAFTRQVVDEAADVPVLLRKAALTFVQSALLLYLRQQLTQADARGERAVVSYTDMREQLAVFERDRNVDRAKFERQANGAVEKAAQLNLIRRLRGEDERYEVSPALKLLFPAEQVQALTEAYVRLAQRGAAAEPTADDALEEDG
ncbi:MAG TPA: DUF4194 domain-containing protein [Polyangiaceae bacterium]|jgi:hypothetical protein|nr:DUF4194 domain-containing protein [Polyangiaceae bacterium]